MYASAVDNFYCNYWFNGKQIDGTDEVLAMEVSVQVWSFWLMNRHIKGNDIEIIAGMTDANRKRKTSFVLHTEKW
jgi:hypothetical protein